MEEGKKKRRNRNKGKSTSEEPEEEGFIDETIIPQPSGAGEIYKNRNFQIAALGVVVIFGLILFSTLN